jgi:hypothetical protein
MISWRGRARKAKKLMTRRSCGYPGLGHGRHRTTALTATTPSPAAFFFRAIGRRAVLRETEGQTRQGEEGAAQWTRQEHCIEVDGGRQERGNSERRWRQEAGAPGQHGRGRLGPGAWGLRAREGTTCNRSTPTDRCNLAGRRSPKPLPMDHRSIPHRYRITCTRTGMPNCHGEPHFPRMITTEAFLPR